MPRGYVKCSTSYKVMGRYPSSFYKAIYTQKKKSIFHCRDQRRAIIKYSLEMLCKLEAGAMTMATEICHYRSNHTSMHNNPSWPTLDQGQTPGERKCMEQLL